MMVELKPKKKPPELSTGSKLAIAWLACAVMYALTGDDHIGSTLFIGSLVIAASNLWHSR